MLSVQKKELSVKKLTTKTDGESSSSIKLKKKKKKVENKDIGDGKHVSSSASSTKSSASTTKSSFRKSSAKKTDPAKPKTIQSNGKLQKPADRNNIKATKKGDSKISSRPRSFRRKQNEKLSKQTEEKYNTKTKTTEDVDENNNNVNKKPARLAGKFIRSHGIKNRGIVILPTPKNHREIQNENGPKKQQNKEKKKMEDDPSINTKSSESQLESSQLAKQTTEHESKTKNPIQTVQNKPPRPPGTKALPRQLKHQDSMGLYKQGYGKGDILTVTKSSTDVEAKSSSNVGRPIFHLPLNLNDSTASFLGNSPSYLELSSGLIPHHPQNKYNFKISFDDTNDMSQTANMLRNYIFDENDDWNTERTEPAHVQKQEINETQNDLEVPALDDTVFDQSGDNTMNPSTETTNRSFGRTSTRLSFLFNKNTGLLCKNCFSSDCNHMEKFNTLATPKLKKVFKGSVSEDDSFDNPELYKQNNSLLDVTTESMRLIDINDFNHTDDKSGENTVFRQINMEHEAQFETSTPNGDIIIPSNIQPPKPNNNDLNLSGSMLRYTPGIMNQSTFSQQPGRPNTNESLKYDSDYDDDSYLRSCDLSFETLDINSGVFFSNTEESPADATPANTKKSKSRKTSLGIMSLPTVFEEKSAPNSAVKRESQDDQKIDDVALESGLQELLDAVYDTLANISDEDDRQKSNDKESEKENNNDTLNKAETEKDKAVENDHNNPNNEQQIKESSEQEHTEEDQKADEEKVTPLPTDTQCSTPLEKQGIFKRISDGEEEKYIEQLKEDQLQAWLQANRKFTFEKDHFLTEDSPVNEDLLDTADEEVLTINTPEWVEKPIVAKSSSADPAHRKEDNEKLDQQQTDVVVHSEQPVQADEDQEPVEEIPVVVDTTTQAHVTPSPVLSPTILPKDENSSEVPGTGESSLPKTQGSYRQIDLLVLDHSRDDRLIQENQLVDAIYHENNRDLDSGINSGNTERSEATLLFGSEFDPLEEQEDQGDESTRLDAHDETAEQPEPNLSEPLSLLDNKSTEEAEHNEDDDNSNSPPHTDKSNHFPQPEPEDDGSRIHLPAIPNKNHRLPPSTFYDSEILHESPIYNRLVINKLHSPFYGSDISDELPSQKGTYSPLLEHHLRMAQYHKDRVELLAPLYSSTNNSFPNRYGMKPRAPPSKVQHSLLNYRRRFSSGSNSYHGQIPNSPDYLDSLSDISPRTRPYVPHPPSYDRARNNSRKSHSLIDSGSNMHTVHSNHDTLYLSGPYRYGHTRLNQTDNRR